MFSRSSLFCHVISCISLLTIIQVKGDPCECLYCECQRRNCQQSPCQHRYIPCGNCWPHSCSNEDPPRILIRKKHKPTNYYCQYPYHSSKCPLRSSTANTRCQTLMWDGSDFISASNNYKNYCPYCNLPKTYKYSDNYFTGCDGRLYCMKQDCCACKRFCRNCPNCLHTDSDHYSNSNNNNLIHNHYWSPVNYSPNTMWKMCCCNDCDQNCNQHVLSNNNKCTSGYNDWCDHPDRNCNCDFSHCGWKMVQMPVQYSAYTSKSGDYGYSSD